MSCLSLSLMRTSISMLTFIIDAESQGHSIEDLIEKWILDLGN